MSRFFTLLILLLLTSCSMGGLKRTDGTNIQDHGTGIILDAEAIKIDGDESLSERVAVGALTGGIVGGVATSITEPGFTEQTVWRYVMKLSDGSYKTQVSRSIVNVGDCVHGTLREGQAYVIFTKVPAIDCAN